MLRCLDIAKKSPAKMPFKKSRLVLSALIVIVVLGFATWLFTRRAAAVSQSNPSPQTPAPAANAAVPRELPPGTIVYKPKAGTLAVIVARKYLAQSSFMTVAELEAAIRKANDGKSSFKKDQEVLVPGIEPQPVVEKNRPYSRDEEIRALYFTGATAGSVRGIELARRWKQAGGNAIVFDIKDSDGSLNIPFDNPLSPVQKNHPITNLPKFVRYIHSLDMHAIARIALFRDNNIAQHHSTLAVQ